jgi:hypothetical protein
MSKEDKAKLSGNVADEGYGMVFKKPLKDKRLSIEAKAIYAFICSYTGAGQTAFPGVQLMIECLGISENRFYKHRKRLVELGYLTVTHRYDGQKNQNNLYTVNLSIDHSRFDGSQNDDLQNDSSQNEGTKSNSLSSLTSLKKNSTPKGNQEKIESEEDVKAFVDFALQNNLLPDQISKKIAIKYFDCIRLTRSSCKISENVLSNLVERMKKYTADQLNYAMWMHTDKHSEKKEQYTLGILRNTDVVEARRGLMKMKNITPKHKGVHYDAGAEQRIKEYSQYNIPF